MLRIILLVVLALTQCVVAAVSAEPVSLMANTSPPYADASLPERGLALELVTHIFTGTHYAPDISIENWSRAVEGARIGVYEGLATAWYSPEREKDLLFSKPYLRSDLLILKLNSNHGEYTTLQQLEGSRLGVRRDFAYGVDFSTVPNLKLVEEDQLLSNLLNLLNGKVDFVIADQRSAAMVLHTDLQDKVTQFVVTNIKLPPVARHVAANRTWPGAEKMIAEFNRSLEAAQKDGSLDAIIKKWDERYGGL
jgi:polar amino acid transport system substrate-binding protein